MSREPSDSHKLQAQSIAETKDAFDAAAKQLARSVTFRGRKLRPGPLLNAVVLHFLSLGEAERERIALDGLAIHEALLEHDDPQDELLRSLLAAAEARAKRGAKVEAIGGHVVNVKADRKRPKKLNRPAGE